MTEQGLSRIFLILFISLFASLQTQAQIWSTDFEGANTGVSLNQNDFNGSPAGAKNAWIINNDYLGGDIGNGTVVISTPGQPIAVVPNSLSYLHVTSIIGGTTAVPPVQNAHTDVTANNNESYFTVIETGLNTTGMTDVQLGFWFINASPVGSAQIYAKANPLAPTWTLLQNSDFSIPLGDTAGWAFTEYTGNVLNGMNNVVLGIRYIHDSVAVQQPAFALDNFAITSPNNVVASVASPSPLPTTVCVGDIVNFIAATNNAINSYQWHFNGANNGPQILSGSNVNFQAINVGTPTTYTFSLIVGDSINFDTTSFDVEISPCSPPDFELIGDPTTICEGSSVNYSNLSTPGDAPIDSIVWAFPGGTPTTSNQNNPVVTYPAAGVYNVLARLYDANGFYDTTMNAYVNVIACPPPEADFEATATVLCPGDCIGFIDNTTNMNGAGSTWLWEFEGADSVSSQVQNPQNICYQDAGLYTVRLTATNPNGTDIEEKLEYIQVDSCLPPRSSFTVERDSLCRNMCVQFFSTSLRADTIEWKFQGADIGYDTSNFTNPTVCYSDTGQFFVQLTTKNIYGVDIALELGYISIAEYPEVRAGAIGDLDQSYTIYVGESVQLEAFGTGTSYLWTPNEAINNPNSRNPTVNPTENTRYYVTTTNDHGCSATDSLRVLVREEYFVGVPDIFSPNGDGENDILRIRGNGITEVEFFVYNRFGEKVFESSNVNIGWDGSFNGEQATPGVFMYFAKVTYENGFEEIIKGDVTLIR